MKSVIKYVIVIVSLFSVQPFVAFSGTYQEWQQQAIEEFDTNSESFAYGKVNPEMRGLVQKRMGEARAFIISHENDSVLWWLIGQLAQRKQLLYHYDLQVAGKNYRLNSPENQALIKEYQSHYQKALELDDNPNAPEHLTAMMLIRIGSDSVGDPTIKVRAQEKAAALARAGKDGTGNEMLEWNTYAARLGIYVDVKDYENALKIVNEMIGRFGSNDELEGYKRQMEAKYDVQIEKKEQ